MEHKTSPAPNIVMAPVATCRHLEENSSRWRCCCSCCHVRTGTKIIIWVEIVFISISLIINMMKMCGRAHHGGHYHQHSGEWSGYEDNPRKHHKLTPGMVLHVLFSAVCLVTAIMALTAIKSLRHRFMIPWFVAQGIGLVLHVVSLVVSILVWTGIFHYVIRSQTLRERELRARNSPWYEREKEDEIEKEMKTFEREANKREGGFASPWASNETADGSETIGEFFDSVPLKVVAFGAGLAAYVLVNILLMFMHVYFVWVVYRCYQFIKLKATGPEEEPPMYQPPYIVSPADGSFPGRQNAWYDGKPEKVPEVPGKYSLPPLREERRPAGFNVDETATAPKYEELYPSIPPKGEPFDMENQSEAKMKGKDSGIADYE